MGRASVVCAVRGFVSSECFYNLKGVFSVHVAKLVLKFVFELNFGHEDFIFYVAVCRSETSCVLEANPEGCVLLSGFFLIQR